MKGKYVLISLDDGTVQDEKVIGILKKYGLKATFNINTGLLGKREELPIITEYGVCLRHDIITSKQLINDLYADFEVACHTLTHAKLNDLNNREIKKEIFKNFDDIKSMTGVSPVGIAYPGMTPNYNRTVKDVLKNDGRILYGRTIDESGDFSFPADFYEWNPTVQVRNGNFLNLTQQFLNEKNDDCGRLLFVWGHSYEFDLSPKLWENFESFCKMISCDGNVKSMTCAEFCKQLKLNNE